jgi:hypothetical protein
MVFTSCSVKNLKGLHFILSSLEQGYCVGRGVTVYNKGICKFEC